MCQLIIYGSEYGTAKAYAAKFSEMTGIRAADYKDIDSLEGFELIIYFGGLYAGGVKGLKKTVRKLNIRTELIIVTVGLANVSEKENTDNIRNSIRRQIAPEIFERAKLFHLRGGIDYKRLGLKHKTMMTLLYTKAKNLPEEKKSPDTKAMIETFGKTVDFTDFASLKPVLNAVQKTNPIRHQY